MRAVRTFRGRNVYVLCLLGIFALSVLVALSFLEFRSENRERIQAVNNAYLGEIARQSNLRISIRMNAAIAYTAMFAELFSSVERLIGPDAAALLQNMAGLPRCPRVHARWERPRFGRFRPRGARRAVVPGRAARQSRRAFHP